VTKRNSRPVGRTTLFTVYTFSDLGISVMPTYDAIVAVVWVATKIGTRINFLKRAQSMFTPASNHVRTKTKSNDDCSLYFNGFKIGVFQLFHEYVNDPLQLNTVLYPTILSTITLKQILKLSFVIWTYLYRRFDFFVFHNFLVNRLWPRRRGAVRVVCPIRDWVADVENVKTI